MKKKVAFWDKKNPKKKSKKLTSAQKRAAKVVQLVQLVPQALLEPQATQVQPVLRALQAQREILVQLALQD
jgi:hypothetical protein